MSAFHGFPDLPEQDDIPFCKLNERYCYGNIHYENITTYTNAVRLTYIFPIFGIENRKLQCLLLFQTKRHPVVNVTRDIHHHRTSDENVSMYIDVDDNLLKKVTSVWCKQGFLEALSVAADPSINRESHLLAVSASYVLKLANVFTALRYFLQPHLKDIGPKIVANYSRTRGWGNVPIKCLVWHPHTTKLAVATSDDNVRIYCSEVPFVSTLKCKAQAHVSSVSWRPYSASELAVGCEQGVIVWTVDPNSMFTKPSSNNAVVLTR